MWTVKRALAAAAAGVVLASVAATPASAAVVSLTGTVVDTTGAPLGACITLVGESGATIDGGCTDTDGRYSVLDVPMGPYKIKAAASGYVDQWANNRTTEATADPVFLMYPHTTTVDFRLYRAPGVISGGITTAGGDPAAAATVWAVPDAGTGGYSGTTDANGNYSITVPPGRYRVSFSALRQEVRWALGQTDRALATVYEVADGGAVEVNDSFDVLGTVEVTIVDAVSGEPVLRGCANVTFGIPSSACTTTGVVRLTDIVPGRLPVEVRPDVTHQSKYVAVEVVRGQTTAVTVPVQRTQSVVTSAVDAKTGAPLANVCVRALAPGVSVSSSRTTACSEADGRIAFRVEGLTMPQTFHLLASTADGSYGTQWVGETGGTGDRRHARTVVSVDGATVTLPAIRVDRPGTVAGRVTDRATGAPVAGVCAHPYATTRGSEPAAGANCTDAQGRYEIRGLGPYRWPVEFVAPMPYALQWSGGASNRIDAHYVKVRPGRTAPANARLLPGATVAVQVTSAAGAPMSGAVSVFNARSGDPLGFVTTDFSGRAGFSRLAPQQLKISLTSACWYDRQSSFGTATPYPVPLASTQAVTLTACA